LRPDAPAGESTAVVRERILRARERQHARAGKTNAVLDQPQTALACRLTEADQSLLERAVDALQLSARSMHRIQRVARTIADLAGADAIATAHLTEAIALRRATRGLETASG
jgi:magnesium chelatase family protein